MRLISFAPALLVCACALVLFDDGAATPRRSGSQTTATTTPPPRVTPCDAVAFVNDPDPRGMNVRSGPGASFKVVGNLPNADVNGISVHITGAQGEWVRIDRADEQGGDTQDRTFFKGVGWVYAPLLSVDGVGGIEGGTKLYQEPSVKSRVVARMSAGGEGATVRGCKGKWLHLEHKNRRGWAAPGTTCSNALTTCS